MSTQVVLQGTLTSDGRLELDERVLMPAGRVMVTVQPVVQPPPNDPFWKMMERIWADQRARGHVPRTREEIDAEIDAMRDDSAEEIQAAEQLHEECQRLREQAESSKRTPQ